MTGAPISDVDSLLGVLESGAGATDGEDIDLLAHGLQCAAVLAGVAPHDHELQVAGLVHDVGTVLWPGRPRTHARAGAAAVADLLGERVAWLVGHHDEAKRYLVTTDPDYASRLSAASVATLEVQGGRLDATERARLDAAPWLADVLTLRRADDDAKVPGRDVPSLSHWRPIVKATAGRTATRLPRARPDGTRR
ncbi:MAG TPA: HD domain-containing protein [Acidimicrobiia bacterium]|nr:HD domain-containing protein [Acidimicrobiia bacterium]